MARAWVFLKGKTKEVDRMLRPLILYKLEAPAPSVTWSIAGFRAGFSKTAWTSSNVTLIPESPELLDENISRAHSLLLCPKIVSQIRMKRNFFMFKECTKLAVLNHIYNSIYAGKNSRILQWKITTITVVVISSYFWEEILVIYYYNWAGFILWFIIDMVIKSSGRQTGCIDLSFVWLVCLFHNYSSHNIKD